MGKKMCAVIVAAGRGSRMGADINKVYLPLAGKTVLAHCISAFAESGVFDEYVIVTGAEDFGRCREALCGAGIEYALIEGGSTRQQSVMRGISAATAEYCAVHDGARALISPQLVRDTAQAALMYGAAAPGVMPKDTPKHAGGDGFIKKTLERGRVSMIQTPQIFLREELLTAHRAAERDGFEATDDCMIMEKYSDRKIKIVAGSYENIKLTTPDDIYTAERIIGRRSEK